ncbi:MAG: amino acid adenylation domain-containing protein [Magnetococcales bacterium]|nr:amino acid adenylation domain-containing protein [Magnetococcales bacterium]
MTKKNIQHIYTLTPMQEGMLFHALHDQAANPYFEQCHFRLRGPLNVPLFETAWNEVVQRHDVLRTRFVFKNIPQPRQVVLKEQKLVFAFQDLSALPGDQQHNRIDIFKKEDWQRGFDLGRDVLMRMTVFRLEETVFEAIHSFHHILLDGWSVGILHEESFRIYTALLKNEAHRLPTPVPFVTYIQWLERQDKSAAESYWRRYLTGYQQAVSLPDCHADATTPFQAEERIYTLAKPLSDAVRQLAARQRVTQNTVIQAVWGVLLGRYNRVHDVVLIATVSGRPPEIAGVERMVGLFINAVPVRIRTEPNTPFDRLLRQVQNSATTAQEYHHHSLAEIQANSDLGQQRPDHILVFENYAAADVSHFSIAATGDLPLRVEWYKQVDHSNYPLTVQVVPGERLGFTMILNRAAMEPATLDALVGNLELLLTQVTNDDTLTVAALTLPALPPVHAAATAQKNTPPLPATKGVADEKSAKKLQLVVAATFTVDPVVPHVRWWGRAFGLAIDVQLAAYNQVFQELLDPGSLLSTHAGYALLLLRFEDWLRDLPVQSAEACHQHLETYYEKLLQALTNRPNTLPLLIGLLPPSPHLPEVEGAVERLADLYRRFKIFIDAHPTLHALDLTRLADRHAIATPFDPHQDQAGHMPFSDAFYAALGQAIARALHAHLAPPFKVIVLDCDNTLWSGICGESGADGVVITPDHQALQRFMLARCQEGFLLALNSKNNAEDVWAVFDNHPDMVLQRSHIVAQRINWQPKPDNMRQLARELDLGLESFLFLDDSGVECAAMMNGCPEVLTLRLPENPADFSPFLHLVWAFDRFQVTEEDRQRSRLYQVEQQRRQLQERSPSLDDFLATLEVEVFMEPMRPEHHARVAQLTQRTNQFNLSTIRRTESDIAALHARDGWSCWCVHVRDRFGDYGLVGVVLAQQKADHLLLETFLLSCRVLGRGVEMAILSGLRRHCLHTGITRLLAEYRPTPKNQPILAFLEKSPLRQEATSATGLVHAAATTALPEHPFPVQLIFGSAPPPAPSSTPAPRTTPLARGDAQPLPHDRSPGGSDPLPGLRWSPGPVDATTLLHKAHHLPLIHATGADLLRLPVEEPLIRDRLTTPHVPLQGEMQQQMALIWQEVLGCRDPGGNDAFFALGGHSLKAVRIVARIQKQWGVEIQLGELFAHPTIAQLCRLVQERTPRKRMTIPPVPSQATYPASNAQLRLWILHQMENHAIAYNTTSLYAFKGSLDGEALAWALDAVAQRHESLRTTFVLEQESAAASMPAGLQEGAAASMPAGPGQLRQRIHPACLTTLLRIDLTGDPDPSTRARALALDDARTPFDLAHGPLYRITLLCLATDHHLLLLTMHHIISDGWSMDILHSETMAFYAARLANKTPPLPPLTIQYKDYAAHQNARLSGPEAGQARTYWQHKLGGVHSPLSLPTDLPRPAVQTFQGRLLVHAFAPDLHEALVHLGQRHQATLFMVLTAWVKILLFHHAGPLGSTTRDAGREIIVGTPVAGREQPELEGQIGLYLNTLALHDLLTADESFASVLAKVRQTVIDAFARQFYPFDRLVEELDLERDMSRSPLFDVMVVMQETMPEQPAPPGLTITTVDVDARISRFDLVFNFYEQDRQLHLALTYNTDLFLPERLQRLVAQMPILLQEILEHPTRPIRELNLLPESERQLLLATFNAHRTPWPRHATILSLFAEQVAATPLAMAILEGEERIDYQQLDAWSSRIACHLQTRFSLHPEEIVALSTDRCAALYAGILGIMKAGGACMPIDPATPQERIDFMLQDSRCRLLLVEETTPPNNADMKDFMGASPQTPWGLRPKPHQEEGHSPSSWTSIPVFQTFKNHVSREDTAVMRVALQPLRDAETTPHQPRAVAPHDLAYVIYTSGSTGQPKGVMVEHGGFVNMALAQIRAFGVTAQDRVLQFASPAFDASMSEIFMALLCGAALVPARQATIQNPERLLDLMGSTGVTVVTFPPIYLNTLATKTRAEGRTELDRLKTLITAGEPPILDDARYFADHVGYFNAYGPTETSVCATLHRVLPESIRPAQSIPIGAPLDNLSLYILDGPDQLVPIGVPGEICVAGPGVARGYLHRPELTAERFVSNPFQPGQRLYRTGDVGRWRADGTIELLGRLDDQVKIRGNRVEPDEVAHLLRQHPEVQEAVVMVRRQTNAQELVAFVTPDTLQPQTLRQWLGQALPAYMVPSRLISLARLPLTISGKVDRKTLLALADTADLPAANAIPPGTELEIRLARTWQKVLNHPSIGLFDDFFALGGDSIKAIQVVAALGDLGLETKDLFLHPTIASLAAALASGALRPTLSEQETITGQVPLTAIQAWFFRDYPVDRHHFNHAEYFFFQERLDEQALVAAMQAVQAHHDMLRARFIPGADGEPVQDIAGLDHPVDCAVIDVRPEQDPAGAIDRETLRLQESLSLEQGPLLKTRLLRLADADQLLIVLHHLVVDAVSWRFLLDDLLRSYEQARAGQAITLPRKSGSFQRWAAGIHAYAHSLRLLRELAYWQQIEAVTVAPLPCTATWVSDQKSAAINQAGHVRDLALTLSREETETIQEVARQGEHRLLDLLLAALAQALNAWCGQESIPIMLEGHGREPIVEGIDISRTLGWFTSVFPVILSATPGQAREEVRRAMRERLAQIPNHGIGYSILRYLTPAALKQGCTLSLQPHISFNYLGDYRFDPGQLALHTASDIAPYRVSNRAAILYDLTFNAIIEGGQLHIFLACNPQKFDDTSLRSLLDALRAFLI